LLAGLAVIVWAVGAATSVRAFVNHGGAPGASLPWSVFPLALVLIGLAATRGYSVAIMWMPIGMLWGFVVLGSWSAGLFYVWTALALTIAGVVHFAAIQSWWHAFAAPLWFLAGVTGCAVFLLAYGNLRARMAGQMIVPAPAVLAGAWLFGAACAAIASAYIGRALWISRARAPAWLALGLTVVIAAFAWFASVSLRRATAALETTIQRRVR